MIRAFLMAASTASLFIAGPATAKLSPAETRMMTVIDADQQRTVDLLQKLVNQNSGSMNLDGVAKVGAMMDAEFKALGFSTQWVDMRHTGRAGHLIATHKGNGRGKRMLLIGHLDTVFEPDSPFQEWKRSGNYGTGPGAGDDKGGIVTIVAALRAMKAAGTLADADIEVVLTGDEEDTGSPLEQARQHLIDAGKRADVALDFEGLSIDDGKDMGVIARRGFMSWSVTARATPSHSSGIFSPAQGYGAIYELVRILDEFRRELTDDKLTYSVGLIGGGQTATLDQGRIRMEVTGKINIIPGTAVALGDFRALTPEQVVRTKAKMAAIVAKHLPGTDATLTFDAESYPPMAPTEGNRALLARLNAVNADLGLDRQEELDPLKRGGGDISLVAAETDGLVGLGPASVGDHAPGETVDIASIWRQTKRAAILMSRLAAEKR